MQVIRKNGVKQAVDPKGASQELHTVSNPLPPIFERLPGQRIIAARERPSNTPLNGMKDLNLSRISAFATRLAWPEGLLGRIRYDRKSSDQSESGQWNVGGPNCPSDQSESGQRNVGGPNCPAPRHQDDSAEPREGDSRAGVKQAVDPKGASQELQAVSNPLPPIFERLPGQRIIAAQKRPSNTQLNGMKDLNLSRISDFATRLAWPEGLLGRIRYDRKSSDQSESGQWNVGGPNCRLG